jgi:putative chitinase
MPLDRKIYFDSVRGSLFSGSISQSQVDGQNAILDAAQAIVAKNLAWVVRDMRHLAYMLATTYHETSKEMQPIEEYGKGEGMSYGKKDPETGQTYFGRGFVQLTWRDNYAKATQRLGLSKTPDDMEWHASRALDPTIASDVMFQGMEEGWFRPPNNLSLYFDEDTDDPYGAREIINGDKKTVPSWSSGVSIGNLIKDYHGKFLAALQDAWIVEPAPPPEPGFDVVHVNIQAPSGIHVSVALNGEIIVAGPG